MAKQKPVLERREILAAIAMGGAATAAVTMGSAMPAQASVSKIEGASLTGPYLNLTDKTGNMIAAARLNGNIDPNKSRFGWYDGIVMGVAPGGPLKNICGFRGFGATKLVPLTDGPGWQKLHREVGYYYDLATGEIMEEMENPYTQEKVRVVHVANDPFNTKYEEYFPLPPNYGGLNSDDVERTPYLKPWRVEGDRLMLEDHIHLYYKNALDPKKWVRESSGPMNRVSEMFLHVISLDDMQNEELTAVRDYGSWNRVTPWLPWMLMGQAPGHCVYNCLTAGGVETVDELPPNIVEYTAKNFPKYLEPPATFEEPSLSSLEMYALEQEPVEPGGS